MLFRDWQRVARVSDECSLRFFQQLPGQMVVRPKQHLKRAAGGEQ